MKRINIFQLGLLVFFLGGLLYGIFLSLGYESASAGIASQAILISLVFVWTASYLLRVFTGKMTFMEQRKKYRQAYDKLVEEKLQVKLDSMSEDEKIELMAEVEKEQKK